MWGTDMPWFYDSRTGAYAEEAGALGFLSNLQAKLGLGWHQYATYQDMVNAITANHWPPLNNNPSNPAGKTVVGSLEGAKNSLGFLQALFTRANAVRLAEGVLGLVLILIAAAELGKGTAVGNIVKKVPFI
jgi:hypothetical protein